MDKLIIKDIPKLFNNKVVNITSEMFETIVNYINLQTDVLNAQSKIINILTNNVKSLQTTDENIYKTLTETSDNLNNKIKIIAEAMKGVLTNE